MPENETQETQETLVLERSEGQNQAPTGEDIETVKAQLADEQKAKAALEQAAAEKDARIAALEGQLQAATTKIATFNAELASATEAKDQAVAKYLGMAKALNPNIPEGIISGSTIEEIDVSLEKGKDTVEAVRKSLEAEAAATKVPAGAPTRGGISVEGMSPREKIAYAISRQSRE